MADIFKSKVVFFGKHAQYLEALTPGTDNAKNLDLSEIERNKYLFDSVVDIYIIAPIVGYLFQRRASRDNSGGDKSIMEGALATHHDKLVFSYELLMILDKESEPDINERIRRAFCANDELTAQGMKAFNNYARGGIEVLYEKLITGAATPEDLLRNLMDFTEEWNEKFIEEDSGLDLEALLHN